VGFVVTTFDDIAVGISDVEDIGGVLGDSRVRWEETVHFDL